MRKLILVTATTNLRKSADRIYGWQQGAHTDDVAGTVVVSNGPRSLDGYDADNVLPNTVFVKVPHFMGSVPAFALGLTVARRVFGSNYLAACLHDDVEITQPNWTGMLHPIHTDREVISGFFGAKELGRSDIYQAPYEPHQLVRGDCYSNMRDAEAHGQRSSAPMRVAVLDGFSTIGWLSLLDDWFTRLALSGIKHHAYDAAIGIMARRAGIPVWMVPIGCHHLGGQTAVADQLYTSWALEKRPAGDQTFWEEAHKIVYAMGKGVLPFRVA